MKKKIHLWQLIVGIALYTGILLSFFLPCFSLNSSKMAKATARTVNKYIEQFTSSMSDEYGISSSLVKGLFSDSKIEETFEDGFEETMEDTFGKKKVSVSPYTILLTPFSKVKAQLLRDGGEIEEKKLSKIRSAYYTLQLAIAFIYIIPILLLAVLILSFVFKWRHLVISILTWCYSLLTVGIFGYWYLMVPGKISAFFGGQLSDSLGILSGNDLLESASEGLADAMLASFFRSLLMCITGVGAVITCLSVMLLLAFPFLLIIFGKKEQMGYAAQVFYSNDGYGENVIPAIQPLTYNQYEPYTPIPNTNIENSDIVPVVDMGSSVISPIAVTDYAVDGKMDFPPIIQSKQEGTVRFTVGTLAGDSLVLQPGEQIIVGRDGMVANVILGHAKVSRKHFLLQYNGETDDYTVFCYSGNGLKLSAAEDGGFDNIQSQDVQQGRRINIKKGTQIILADGEEVIRL